MDPDFSSCLVLNTRMAARAVTRRYDGLLRPHGVTAAQFALLGGLKRGAGRMVSEIAARNGLDRTSLTRNLDRLERIGLIASRPAEKGNGRLCALTAEGEALVGRLVPIWVAAQAEMRKELSTEGFSATLEVLRRLSHV